MKRMAYHLLAILIWGMAASAVKAQILLTASATPIEEYAAVELQRYCFIILNTKGIYRVDGCLP